MKGGTEFVRTIRSKISAGLWPNGCANTVTQQVLYIHAIIFKCTNINCNVGQIAYN